MSTVIVIGGGYAGVMAANRLTQRDDVTVTVVNPRPRFVPRLRLHQLVAGTHEAVVDYREVLAGRVRLVVDSVAAIDASGRRVMLTGGDVLRYDYLIYAVGSHTAESPVPGAGEFAYPVATFEAAQRLRAVIEGTAAEAMLTVVGAGPTGVETAAELAEQGRRVTLVCGGDFAPYLHKTARRAARRRFADLGVTVLDGTVTAVTRDSVRLDDGREVPAAVTIWTAGFGVPDLAARSGLRTDPAGRLLTDETLTTLDDDRIVAAGDSAAPSGAPFRMSAYAAGCLGAHAADTVLHRIAGEAPAAMRLLFPAVCVSFGREAGTYQLLHRDDRPLPLFFGGRTGVKLKEIACRAGVEHLAKEAARPGSHRWLKTGA